MNGLYNAQAGPSTYQQSPIQNTSASSPDNEDDTAESTPNVNGNLINGHVPLVEPNQDLQDFLQSFWTRQIDTVENETPDFKTCALPLARIKKVMKSDEDVKMISAEAPILFSRACEIFISELTCRAWLIAESHKRRTLQKSDVAAAIALSDMFDFLIDIVPRDEDQPSNDNKANGGQDGNAEENEDERNEQEEEEGEGGELEEG